MPTLLSILDSWLNLAQVFQYKLLLLFDVLSLHGQLLLDLLRGHLPLLSLLLVFNLQHILQQKIIMPSMDPMMQVWKKIWIFNETQLRQGHMTKCHLSRSDSRTVKGCHHSSVTNIQFVPVNYIYSSRINIVMHALNQTLDLPSVWVSDWPVHSSFRGHSSWWRGRTGAPPPGQLSHESSEDQRWGEAAAPQDHYASHCIAWPGGRGGGRERARE